MISAQEHICSNFWQNIVGIFQARIKNEWIKGSENSTKISKKNHKKISEIQSNNEWKWSANKILIFSKAFCKNFRQEKRQIKPITTDSKLYKSKFRILAKPEKFCKPATKFPHKIANNQSILTDTMNQ